SPPATPVSSGSAQGFSFRKTAGFVADHTGVTYVLCSDTYPTVRNGVTFGWESGNPQCIDDSASIDARLAGIAYTQGSVPMIFRADVPAGQYDAMLAMGSTT